MHIFQAISFFFCFLFFFQQKEKEMVGTNGLEPSTSRLSGVRSNRLSYRPMQGFYWVQFPFPTYINISL